MPEAQPRSVTIDEINAADDAAVCSVIKTVGAEYNALSEGYGPGDAEVQCMSQHYSRTTKSLYLVARVDGVIVGGGGVASFAGRDDICELRKLFLLAPYRGQGIGRQLLQQCLEFAAAQGYRQCYLDTLKTMTTAMRLYETFGFDYLTGPLPGAEHSGCNVWMLKNFN